MTKKEKLQMDGLAQCVVFAINNFPNKPVMSDGKLITLHAWFKEALAGAGYTLTEPERPKKGKRA